MNVSDTFCIGKTMTCDLCFIPAMEECGLESTNHFDTRKQKERKDEWSQKMMHGQFIRQTVDVTDTNLGCGYRNDT